jgi:cyclohexa-1,5-dienecarbonyl-CoA hydratase
MPAGYKDIHFSVTDRAARIVLSKPPLNVLTISMMKEIADAINRVGSMPEVCALVLSASPSTRAFSAGTSVEEHRPETVYQMLEAFHSIFRAMNIASKPVIAAVSGAALGGGCELVAFADIVIATHSARFGQPEIKIGVFPPVSSIMLPRVIGEKKAREMILTGDLITAEEARQLGLVNYVVGEAELEQKTKEVLDKLRQMSAPALEMSRRAVVEAFGLPFEEALKRTEDIYLNQLMSHKDPIEGIQAFIEKRAPQWKHK